MYVSYLVDQENTMYPGCRKYPNSSFPMQNFPSNSHYSEYMAYHNTHSMDNHGHPSDTWGHHYGLQAEDYNCYGAGSSATSSSTLSGLSNGQLMYEAHDYSTVHHSGSGVMPIDAVNVVHTSSNNQRNQSYDWVRKTIHTNPTGKTRTKEKYRVVYTDHQRLELEKEFLSNRYITIRRKSEIALSLGLSDRQVKIWFQNRRAKERKLIKKIGQFDGNMCPAQCDSGSVSPTDMTALSYPQSHAMDGLQSLGNLPQVVVSQ